MARNIRLSWVGYDEQVHIYHESGCKSLCEITLSHPTAPRTERITGIDDLVAMRQRDPFLGALSTCAICLEKAIAWVEGPLPESMSMK